jgi:protein-S-isoprenylcysteine O-methyltransferase Ste14
VKKLSYSRLAARVTAQGGIIVFFIMAFEIAIMISPFAFFFYSVFNPLFQFIDTYPALRWLTSFFLPHMILPPTPFLMAIRVLGSILFIVGCLTFLVCALQVYLGKIFKWGIADKGLYRFIRHPQYLALGVWGCGMCILWPRFIVLASLAIMFVLYYFLAKDEERRMIARYSKGYKAYRKKTGMFVPRLIEQRFPAFMPNKPVRALFVPALTVAIVMGAGFLLRQITLHSLPLATEKNVTLVAMLPEDSSLDQAVLDSITRQKGLLNPDKDFLGYLMPADYVMQGMIADTGTAFHLFKQHNTIALIIEWVLHPFSHLRASPTLHMAQMRHVDPAIARRHHCPLGIDDPGLDCGHCPYRRVILVEIDRPQQQRYSGAALLSFDTTRIPVCFVDINAVSGEIIRIRQVGRSTAWQGVPTPAI